MPRGSGTARVTVNDPQAGQAVLLRDRSIPVVTRGALASRGRRPARTARDDLACQEAADRRRRMADRMTPVLEATQ
jgi:hypothetical protein